MLTMMVIAPPVEHSFQRLFPGFNESKVKVNVKVKNFKLLDDLEIKFIVIIYCVAYMKFTTVYYTIHDNKHCKDKRYNVLLMF